MTVSVDFSKPMALSLEPENAAQELIQGLYILLNTTLGEVPCYREFGIDPAYLHKPTQVAQTMYAAAITEAIEKFMPEVMIESITFSNDPNDPSTLFPKLEVTIEDE